MPKWNIDIFYDVVHVDFDDALCHRHSFQLNPVTGRYDDCWRIAIETERHVIRVIALERKPRWGTATLRLIRETYGKILRYDVVKPGFPFPYQSNISVNHSDIWSKK